MSSSEISRTDLIALATQVKPALATQSHLAVLQHIRFSGERATAFDDITAISVPAPGIELECCVPGDLLLRGLNSFVGKNVALMHDAGKLIVTSGRGRLTLPTLPVKDFPLEEDAQGKPQIIELERAVLAGIEACLFSVGADPTHPEQMGVTLSCPDGRHAVLCSTDNFSMSRYVSTAKIKLPGDSPIILPTFFCEQLLALAKAFPKADIDLEIYPGGIAAQIGKARLFSRMLVEREPYDFEAMFAKRVRVKELSELPQVPPGMEAALDRALLVLGPEVDKVTEIRLSDGSVRLLSASGTAEADDRLEVDGDPDFDSPKEIHVDPALMARVLKRGERFGFLDKAAVVAAFPTGGTFVHLIAYCGR